MAPETMSLPDPVCAPCAGRASGRPQWLRMDSSPCAAWQTVAIDHPTLRDQGVAGSNPVSPTIEGRDSTRETVDRGLLIFTFRDLAAVVYDCSTAAAGRERLSCYRRRPPNSP